MAHSDKLIEIFNATKGGIEVTELCLRNCKLRGSLFFWLIGESLHSLSLTNIHIFEGNLQPRLD